MSMLPNFTSMQQIQRNYRKIFDDLIKNGAPLIVLNNNRPEVVVLSYEEFTDMQKKAEAWEISDARKAIRSFEKDHKKGKLLKHKSLKDLLDDQD